MYNSRPPLGMFDRRALLAYLGTQLLIDLDRCNPRLLGDLEFVRRTLMDAAVAAGATIVGDSFHRVEAGGVTGVVAIAESHLTVHTWPAQAQAAVDILTCGPSLKPRLAADLIIEGLECRDAAVTEVRRGEVDEPVAVSSR